MSRSSNSAKVTQWRQRFRRFPQSGLSVVSFCKKERVSVPSFYHWRKKLAQTPPRRRRSAEASAFRPVTVVTADQVVSIELGGVARIEVPSQNCDAVRAVVGELVRADHACRTGDLSC